MVTRTDKTLVDDKRKKARARQIRAIFAEERYLMGVIEEDSRDEDHEGFLDWGSYIFADKLWNGEPMPGGYLSAIDPIIGLPFDDLVDSRSVLFGRAGEGPYKNINWSESEVHLLKLENWEAN